MRKTLTILLALVLLICAIPLAATAETLPPAALGAPENFGASHYYGASIEFTFSAPEDLRNYIEKWKADDTENHSNFTTNFQLDYRIDNGSWHHTSDWDSPKTVPDGIDDMYFVFGYQNYYNSNGRWDIYSLFQNNDDLKPLSESGWEYFKNHSITFRARFAISFDYDETFVLSPWSKEFTLSAKDMIDYNKLINHAPSLISAELKAKPDGEPYFYLRLGKVPEDILNLHAISGSNVRAEVWMRGSIDEDFKYITYEWAGSETIYISVSYYFTESDYAKINYEAESYEIKVRYALDLRSYKQSGYDSSSSNVDIYGPFSNVISRNIPAWSKASQWATPELMLANEAGLIPEILKGADMTGPITREEFAELAVKLYEQTMGITPEPASPNPFTDTTNPQILKAYKLGITTGTSATTFSPKELTNREQVATMLSRAIRTMAPNGDFSTSGSPSFSDVKDISSWALDHVLFMAKLEIIKGTDGKFMPKATTTAEIAAGYATTTREQAIAMSVRSFDKLKNGSLGKLEENTSTAPAQPAQPKEPVSSASDMPKSDDGVSGVWLGTFFPYDGLGLRFRWMTFFEDGTFYFDLPAQGFIGYDRAESKKKHEDYWGTYNFSEGSGVWKYNREIGSGSEMTIADDGGLDTGGYGRFYRCVSVDGLKLNGSYTTYANPSDPDLKKEGIKPVIRFKPDGSFVDDGLYMSLDPLIEDESQRAPGSGTYEIKDYTLILHYNDGRTKQAGFTLGYKGSIEESPAYIFIHYMLMSKMP